MAKQKDPNKVDRRKEKRGPRTSFFSVAAVGKNGDLVHKEIQAKTKEEAATIFKAETKLIGNVLDGLGSGYYQIKGTPQTQANRLVVTMSMEDVQYGKNRWKAILNGYHVLAQGLQACKSPDGQEFKADELTWVIIQAPVDKENKPPKPRLGDMPLVRFSDLENPQPVTK